MNVNIGNVKVNRQSAAKLLGMKFEDNLKWSEHFHGKGGVIPSLNQRLFLLRRLKSQLNKQSLRKVAEAIFTSKIRYGLQLLGKVRVKINDPKQGDLDSIQKIQNKLIRMLNNVTLVDRQSTKSLLSNIDMLSVNQLNASIKLTEVWKAINNDGCPLKLTNQVCDNQLRQMRTRNDTALVQNGVTEIRQATFLNDGIRLWNLAPAELKTCKSLFTVKKQIKAFAKLLPV